MSRLLDDPFQEAEYAGVATLAPLHGQPVMIHGGMDVLPPQVAGAVCAAGHRLLCVRMVDAAIQAFAFAVFAGLLVVFAGVGPWRATGAALLPAAIVLVLLDGSAAAPVQLQQAVPGVRDLVALLALWPMLRVARAIDGARRPDAWPFAVLGALAGAAPFWAYNRGLVLVAVAGAFVLGACWLQRTAWPLCWAAAGGAAAVLAAPLCGAGWDTTAANILYWARNGAIWNRAADPTQLLPALAVHAAAAGLAGLSALSAWRAGRRGRVLLLGALVLTAGLYVVQSWGRVDAVHMRWTLWPALLLLAAGIAHLLGPQTRLARPALVASGVIAMCFIASLRFMDPAIGGWGGMGANLRLIGGADRPDDAALAGPDMMRIAGMVRAEGRCTFAFDNAAFIHMLSGAPPCSRFAFGAYVAPSQQDSVIAELQAGDPAVILWDATFWWARIDRVPMTERLPVLNAWIAAAYPVVTQVGAHRIRTRTPL